MRTTLSMIIWAGALALFFSSCNLLGEKKEKPAIPGKIVFSMSDGESKQIYVMNADGSGIKQLTNFESDEAYQPSWSPDGEQIVFSTSLNGTSGGGMSLYIMNADGSDIHPMKERPNTTVPVLGSHARWSPDGTKIAYYSSTTWGGGNREIFIYDIEADSVVQITDHPGHDIVPSWSPDGSQIAFTSNRDYVNEDTLRFKQELYMMNEDGSDQTRVTETGHSGVPGWNKPGWNTGGNEISNVTFRTTDSISGIYQLDIQTGEVFLLVEDPSKYILWLPYAWSPLGTSQLLVKTLERDPNPEECSEISTLLIFNTQSGKTQKILSRTDIGSADWFIQD